MNDTEKHVRIKRLKYRANHRGIKEMDIILGGFADQCLDKLDDPEIDAFERLMNEQDRDLLIWFTGEVDFPLNALNAIFQKVRSHAFGTRQHD